MIIRKMSRRLPGAKRLDVDAIRDAVLSGADVPNNIKIGVVKAADPGSPYYTISDDGLLIDVELQPSGEEVTALMCVAGGNEGNGVWEIPDEGVEVVVLLPDGALDFRPTIIPTSSGKVPERLAPGRLLVVGKRIEIIAAEEIYLSSDGVAGEPLITKSQFDAHLHPTGVGPSGTPNNAATSGTTVVRGE